MYLFLFVNVMYVRVCVLIGRKAKHNIRQTSCSCNSYLLYNENWMHVRIVLQENADF